MRWQWSPFSELSLDDLYAALSLRQAVFVVEQDCPYLDADGLDAQAHHLLGWKDGELVAYLRTFPPGVVYAEACIGRVVTSQAVRRDGFGRALMETAHARMAETYGATPIKLSAQAYLERFYASLGYAVVGPGYDEDGIPHLQMRRA